MEKLKMGHHNGHWLILNNIHLMPRWLVELEKQLDIFALEGSHKDFRLFLTSEPTPYDPVRAIPIGILARSIKLTQEAPTGLKANLRRGFNFFDEDDFEDDLSLELDDSIHKEAVISGAPEPRSPEAQSRAPEEEDPEL